MKDNKKQQQLGLQHLEKNMRSFVGNPQRKDTSTTISNSATNKGQQFI